MSGTNAIEQESLTVVKKVSMPDYLARCLRKALDTGNQEAMSNIAYEKAQQHETSEEIDMRNFVGYGETRRYKTDEEIADDVIRYGSASITVADLVSVSEPDKVTLGTTMVSSAADDTREHYELIIAVERYHQSRKDLIVALRKDGVTLEKVAMMMDLSKDVVDKISHLIDHAKKF